jgi:hypothetical protein
VIVTVRAKGYMLAADSGGEVHHGDHGGHGGKQGEARQDQTS